MGRPAKKIETIPFDYFSELKKKYKTGRATERTYYPVLEKLINQHKRNSSSFQVINESKRIECGAPDFIILRKNIPIGYVEAKDINTNLEETTSTEQLKRYLSGLSNLILTDYLTFKWYVNGEHLRTVRVGEKKDNQIRFLPNEDENLKDLIYSFLEVSIPMIKSSEELAKRLANKAKIISSSIVNTFQLNNSDSQWLCKWLKVFQDVLLKDLNEVKFADMFSQTLTYGFFTAWIHDTHNVEFSKFSAARILPKTNPFLRKLFKAFIVEDMPETINWAVDEIVEILKHTAKKEILKDFNVGNRKDDPVVHFYETFLSAYDPKLKEIRGVYYTPQPIVTYIVQSTDLILKKHFKKEKGLADDKTLILDPATGTGSFLFKVLEKIHSNFKHNKGIWNSYVFDNLLKRLHGFEILMAPYSVAHLKLSMQLQDTGYKFKKNERLGVYLTNTLEEAAKKSQELLFDWISKEADKASAIKKDKPIMVILGNPPYSGESANKGEWISNLLKGRDLITNIKASNYFECDNLPLKERNTKWLNDDYVKFIRFAQWRVERTGHGVIAFITNHAFLENITFKGMRESILKAFDEIYVFDLHGSVTKKIANKEIDENVFDIKQGVAISFFIKKGGSKNHKKAKLFRADIKGTRLEKYNYLSNKTIDSTQWTEVQPVSPNYFFKTQVKSNIYNLGWKISDIFPSHSLGIITARDELTIHFNEKDVWDTVTKFSNLPVEEARHDYNLRKDTRDWKIHLAQKDLKNSGLSKKKIYPIYYRPFDKRYTYYTGQSKGFHCMPRDKVMKHMLGGKNIAINICRQAKTSKWSHVFVTNSLTEGHICEVSYTMPLFKDDNQITSKVNLNIDLINSIKKYYKAEFKENGLSKSSNEFTAKEVLYYIYAVLNSDSFIKKYGSLLQIDFPRVPFLKNKKYFKRLSKFGEQLVICHTLDAEIESLINFPERGPDIIDQIKFDKNTIWINKNQYFVNIPTKAWNFQIGGYIPAQKWLKTRKGKKLAYNEIMTYKMIIENIKKTIEIQCKIDQYIKNIGGWDVLLKNQISSQ